MAKTTPNREIILAKIQAGGATRESLKAELGLTPAALATNFTYLRLMGFYPVDDNPEKILRVVSKETWEAIKDERSANAKPRSTKTPEERLNIAQKRVARAVKALDNAKERMTKDPSELNRLYCTSAEAEKALAEYLLVNIDMPDEDNTASDSDDLI